MKFLKYIIGVPVMVGIMLGANFLWNQKIDSRIKLKQLVGYSGEVAQPFNLVTDSTTTPATTTNWFGSLRPAADQVYDLGSTSLRWRNIYGTLVGSSGGAATGTAGQIAFYATQTTTVSGTSSIFIDSSSRVNIGSSTNQMDATLSVVGLPGHMVANFASSSGTSYLHIMDNGKIGINTTTPPAQLTIQGTALNTSTFLFQTYDVSNTLTMAIDGLGNFYTENAGLYVEASSSISYVNSLQTGPLSFPADAGVLNWVDLPSVSTTLATGTVESYTANINGSPMLTVYGEADGVGAIKATSTMLGFGTTTPQYFMDVWSTSSSQNIFRLATSSNSGFWTVQSDGIVRQGRANILTTMYVGTTDGCLLVSFSNSTTAPTYASTTVSNCNP